MHESAMQPAPHEHQASGLAIAPPSGRAVAYLRVSCAGQVRRDYDPEGISIPAQREACRRKAEQLGLTIVDDYVEPGRSALEMSKRAAFQRMLARIRDIGDIDHVIVYKLSRMARNRVDDALVVADPRQRGVTLISATESVDDTPVGQLMHGILATFNEYQSRESGADIAYKMGQKARNGGPIARARLGYLNHIDRTDGRDIRTIVVNPERAPLVRLGFELYAAGNRTLDQLSERLYQRGLRTRPTARHPAQRVSTSKLARMLRDRYYLGYITYRDEELPGRHEPLIDQHLFDRVRRRDEYTYFFCRNRQQGTCPAPYVNVAVAEQAVERYYTTVSQQQQITDALATLTAVDTADHDPSRTRDPVQVYRSCTDNQRRLLNHTLFRQLYSPTTASPTTNHGRRHPWPKQHQPQQPRHLRGVEPENRL